MIQRLCESKLNPPALGDKAQSSVGAGVIKPLAVERVLDFQGPTSQSSGLMEGDVRQECAWRR